MAASPVQYVRDAELKGCLSGNKDEGVVCCADTGFWVGHTKPLNKLAGVKGRGVEWPFGDLPEEREFLVRVKEDT